MYVCWVSLCMHAYCQKVGCQHIYKQECMYDYLLSFSSWFYLLLFLLFLWQFLYSAAVVFHQIYLNRTIADDELSAGNTALGKKKILFLSIIPHIYASDDSYRYTFFSCLTKDALHSRKTWEYFKFFLHKSETKDLII